MILIIWQEVTVEWNKFVDHLFDMNLSLLLFAEGRNESKMKQ